MGYRRRPGSVPGLRLKAPVFPQVSLERQATIVPTLTFAATVITEGPDVPVGDDVTIVMLWPACAAVIAALSPDERRDEDNDYTWVGQPGSVDEFKRRVRVRMAVVAEEARSGRVASRRRRRTCLGSRMHSCRQRRSTRTTRSFTWTQA